MVVLYKHKQINYVTPIFNFWLFHYRGVEWAFVLGSMTSSM
jgi:hypothetical protein